MAKAEQAIKTAPGVLAVKVEYESRQATIGTEMGRDVPTDEILAALAGIGYEGKLIDQSSEPLKPDGS